MEADARLARPRSTADPSRSGERPSHRARLLWVQPRHPLLDRRSERFAQPGVPRDEFWEEKAVRLGDFLRIDVVRRERVAEDVHELGHLVG